MGFVWGPPSKVAAGAFVEGTWKDMRTLVSPLVVASFPLYLASLGFRHGACSCGMQAVKGEHSSSGLW